MPQLIESLIGAPVALLGLQEAGCRIAAWAREPVGRMVCAMNVHSLMEAHDDPSFAAVLSGSDLVVADGRPLVWASKLARADVTHVRGTDLMLHVCGVAARDRLAVGLLGGDEETNDALRQRLESLYGVGVVYAWSPPFRPLTAEEEGRALAEIAAAGVRILFVGLGCPKQERWMAANRSRLACVALGVGAAFDMVAGRCPVAPRWMQVTGLEWAFRLALEPRRLAGRYAKHNVRFAALLARQWVKCRTSGAGA